MFFGKTYPIMILDDTGSNLIMDRFFVDNKATPFGQPQFLHLDIRTQSDLHSRRHGLHKTEMGLLGLASGVPMGIHGERLVTFFAKK